MAAASIEVLRPSDVSVPELRSMFAGWSAVAASVAVQALVFSFRQTWRLRTFLLFVGVAVLGSVYAISSVLLLIVHVSARQSVTAGPAFGSLIAAACLAVAAGTPEDHTLPIHRRWDRIGLVAVAFVVGVVELAGARLVSAIDPTSNVLRGVSASGRPFAIAIFVLTITLFGVAAARFAAMRSDDRPSVGTQLAAGCLLLAFAPAERLITPAPGVNVISVAVVTELAGFCLIAVGARRSMRVHQMRNRAAAAANLARARLARDLHDGLCQDLAFIVANMASLREPIDAHHPVAIAAERALATARGTLDQFAVTGAEMDVASALKAVAEELATRFAMTVEVRAQILELTAADTEDVVRIAREAIVNAARHGRARKVTVELSGTAASFVLKVSDDGCGFSPTLGGREGFGMTAMHERAARLGGWVTAVPGPSGGTDLQLAVLR